MLPRDVQGVDYLQQYYPKTDFGAFQRDLFFPEKKMLHFVALDDKDSAVVSDVSSKGAYVTLFTAVTSFITVLAYNKVPLINRVQSRWPRFLLKTAIIVLPTWTVSNYNVFKQQMFVEQLYDRYQEKFRNYKYTGDIRCLNPNVRLV